MDGVSQISVLGFFEVYFLPIKMGLRQVEQGYKSAPKAPQNCDLSSTHFKAKQSEVLIRH